LAKVANEMKKPVIDLDFLKGSAVISMGTAIANALGLAFSIAIADAFPSSDFGKVQYFIALSAFVAIATQPFGQHTIARFVGKYKKDPEKLQIIISNSMIILMVIFILSAIIAVPILMMLGQSNLGIYFIFFGTTIFYTYWGLTTGFLQAQKLTLAYIGSNLVQIIVVVLVVYVLNINSILLVLSIYGLSYVLPLLLLQFYAPLPVKLMPGRYDPKVIKEILHFSLPIWISHASYVGFFNIDILLVEKFVSSQELGAFALTRTLTTIFGFVPIGISSLLMPKIASEDDEGNLDFLKKMLVISLIGNLIVFAIYVLSIEWVTVVVFGEEYTIALIVSVLMGLNVIIQGVYKLIVSYLVGTNRPVTETIGRIMAVISLLIVGLILMPTMGALGAAIAKLLAIIVAIVASLFASRYLKPSLR
jgi:O-antigen/teichoic acid export membrane protein